MAASKKTRTKAFTATVYTPWLRAGETGDLPWPDPQIDWYVKGGVLVHAPEAKPKTEPEAGNRNADSD